MSDELDLDRFVEDVRAASREGQGAVDEVLARTMCEPARLLATLGEPRAAGLQAALAEGTRLDPDLSSSDVQVTTDATTATVTINYSFKTLTVSPGLPRPMSLVRSVTLPLAAKTPGDTVSVLNE